MKFTNNLCFKSMEKACCLEEGYIFNIVNMYSDEKSKINIKGGGILMKPYILTIPYTVLFAILGIVILGGLILYFKKSKNKK